MQRFFLKLGDKSTADGIVIEGEPRCLHHGTPLTYVGAKVRCRRCDTIGYIEAAGPRLPMMMMGRMQALEDDICICECDPPPKMMASQRNTSQGASPGNAGAFPGSVATSIHRQGSAITSGDNAAPMARWIEFSLSGQGNCAGMRCAAHFSDGSVAHGTFDTNNRVRLARQNASACQKIEVLAMPIDQSAATVLDSFLTAMRQQ